MKTSNKAQIHEIFTSVQGEGPYVGEKQQFIRFCDCNLNCNYCDTDHSPKYSFDAAGLKQKISDCTLSLTGGEPLLQADFLKEFLEIVPNKIYLETNGILHKELAKIIDRIDIIAADIKIPSATAQNSRYEDNEKFIQIAKNAKKEIFIKVVFDFNITDEEIKKTAQIARKYDLLLILQPKMPLSKSFEEYFKIHDKFLRLHHNTRLIGQTHKFFNVP